MYEEQEGGDVAAAAGALLVVTCRVSTASWLEEPARCCCRLAHAGGTLLQLLRLPHNLTTSLIAAARAGRLHASNM